MNIPFLISGVLAVFLMGQPGPVMALEADATESKDGPPAIHAGGTIAPGAESRRESDRGGWFPAARLYPAMIADPRLAGTSGALRYGDRTFNRYRHYSIYPGELLGRAGLFGAFSLGTPVALYQWDRGERGAVQIGLEGCVWALFALKERSRSIFNDTSTMMNADYSLALPLVYAWKNIALRYRFYHVSTHVGDEFLVTIPGFAPLRKNVSFEAVDLFVSWFVIPAVRLYAGGGYIVHSFQSARMAPAYVEYGAEFRPFKTRPAGRSLTWQPFAAAHVKHWQVYRWSPAGTYQLGCEFAAARPAFASRMRLFVQYRHGPSLEGQFSRIWTSHVSSGISYDFL